MSRKLVKEAFLIAPGHTGKFKQTSNTFLKRTLGMELCYIMDVCICSLINEMSRFAVKEHF